MVTYADCDVFISQINLYVSGLPWVFKRDIFVSQRTFVSSLPFVSKGDVFVSQRTFLFQVFLVFPKVTSSFLWKPFCFRISYVSNGDVFVSQRTCMSQDFLVYPTVTSSFLRERLFQDFLCSNCDRFLSRWTFYVSRLSCTSKVTSSFLRERYCFFRFSEKVYVSGLPVFQLRPLPFSVNLSCLKTFLMSQDFLTFPTVTSSFLWEPLCLRTSLCIQRWHLRFSENVSVSGLPCVSNGDVFLDANYPGAADHIQRNFQLLAAFVVGYQIIAIIAFKVFGMRVMQWPGRYPFSTLRDNISLERPSCFISQLSENFQGPVTAFCAWQRCVQLAFVSCRLFGLKRRGVVHVRNIFSWHSRQSVMMPRTSHDPIYFGLEYMHDESHSIPVILRRRIMQKLATVSISSPSVCHWAILAPQLMCCEETLALLMDIMLKILPLPWSPKYPYVWLLWWHKDYANCRGDTKTTLTALVTQRLH